MITIRTHLTFAAACLLISSVPFPVQATEKQIADLEEEIAALKVQMEELGGPGNAATQLLSNIETAKKEIEKAKEEIPEKEKALAAKNYLLGVYQSAFRVVTTMVAGDNLGNVQLTTGEMVSGASFLRMDRGAILVQTGTASRSIPISQLPAALAAKFALPPNIASPTITLEAVKTSKPKILRSKEELVAMSAPTPVLPTGNAPAVNGAVSAPQASPEDAYAQVQQRNAARQKKIAELKDRYAVLFQEKKKARNEKAASEATFRAAKIKKAQSEINTTMAIHNSQIQRIEEEEAGIRNEISRIQSEFE